MNRRPLPVLTLSGSPWISPSDPTPPVLPVLPVSTFPITKDSAIACYQALRSEREQFLDMGRRAAKLTLPYLLTEEGQVDGGPLRTPWQSVGAKGCNVLASKMMLSLFPVNTTFFKLQVNDGELAAMPDVTPEVRSEIDLSLNKMERIVMQQIAESSDRVALHAAMKHLVVTGNALHAGGSSKVFPNLLRCRP